MIGNISFQKDKFKCANYIELFLTIADISWF